MSRLVILLLWMFATEAWAATPRCGTDDFGNAVCIDKNGVVTSASQAGQVGEAGAKSLAGASDAEAEPDEKRERRCGIDPFGNRVCR